MKTEIMVQINIPSSMETIITSIKTAEGISNNILPAVLLRDGDNEAVMMSIGTYHEIQSWLKHYCSKSNNPVKDKALEDAINLEARK